MCIFLKTEVQTVILRCWTGLNLNWFKSYGLRLHLKPCASSAISQKIATDKWPCTDHNLPFFANYILIFHKTEIQTVILRCLTSLNHNWYKSYDTKRKNAKNTNVWFCTKSPKKEMEIFAFCVITFEPIRIYLSVSFISDQTIFKFLY